ncbi:hypothetical protein E2542_SST23388 [Spatholobus suberectus]|nr:hypothetical protein E2542_SST23388 [Spatholobus suberectus]
MIAILKVLAIILVIARVSGQCALSNLDVHQYYTGRPYKGTYDYAVPSSIDALICAFKAM